MTLNGVMAVILRYFSEFAYLPGALRKSSRSLIAISSPDEFLYSSSGRLACVISATNVLYTVS